MKVDVSRRIDQIQFVDFAVSQVSHRDGASLDRNAAVPLQFHVVQQLLLHLPHA